MVLSLFVINRLLRMPLGRAWEALREDEIACRSLGLSPRRIKLTAFTISAAFAGFAGTLFAARQGFVSPESFTFAESAFVLAIVVLGGMGSQFAVILAAVLYIMLVRRIEVQFESAIHMRIISILLHNNMRAVCHHEFHVTEHRDLGEKGHVQKRLSAELCARHKGQLCEGT